jgi:hypothetical protein
VSEMVPTECTQSDGPVKSSILRRRAVPEGRPCDLAQVRTKRWCSGGLHPPAYHVSACSTSMRSKSARFCRSRSNAFKSEHPCHAEHVCFFLRDRPGETQPSHLGNQRGSFQSQFCRRAVRSTDGSNRPAEVFPKSKRDPSLPRPSMSNEIGCDADWRS